MKKENQKCLKFSVFEKCLKLKWTKGIANEGNIINNRINVNIGIAQKAKKGAKYSTPSESEVFQRKLNKKEP